MKPNQVPQNQTIIQPLSGSSGSAWNQAAGINQIKP